MESNEVTNVAVCGGGAAEMSGCTLEGAWKLHGMSVHGFSSAATTEKCSFLGNEQINVCVYKGASAGLTECILCGAKSLHGMQVGGRHKPIGTGRLLAQGARLQGGTS